MVREQTLRAMRTPCRNPYGEEREGPRLRWSVEKSSHGAHFIVWTQKTLVGIQEHPSSKNSKGQQLLCPFIYLFIFLCLFICISHSLSLSLHYISFLSPSISVSLLSVTLPLFLPPPSLPFSLFPLYLV